MRSTKPVLVDLRTELLSQTGHSETLLAKVRCMGTGHPPFCNYEEAAAIRRGWGGGPVRCWYPDRTNSYGCGYGTRRVLEGVRGARGNGRQIPASKHGM